MRRLSKIAETLDRNSLKSWWRVRNPIRVAVNFLVIFLCRMLPSLRVKNFLYRLIGVKVGRNVSVGLYAVFDIFYPELIEIKDNAIIGYGVTILAHEFLAKEARIGRVVVGKNAVVGANTTILPGVVIGDDAVVSAMSLVNRDVKPGVLAGGVPAKVIRKRGR
ncbi:MAG: acyltransferase [Candidatus Altiarchaeales archaeon]|nr:acyltransferase [Candidatus Altiarchaeales archaeon]